MYILLVGPPGVGKGNAVKPMQRMLRKLGSVRLSPRGLSKRAFYDEMQEAQKTEADIIANTSNTSASIAAVIEELGVFLLPRDYEFMDALADIYDNPEVWSYRTRHAGSVDAQNPNFNMIACSTPKGLKERFTDDIFEMGLPARISMVYADDKVDVPLFEERAEVPGLESDLIHDLEQISLIKGDYVWEDSTALALQAWVVEGMKPKPADPRFAHYCARRLAHLTKLCVISAAARTDELVIRAEDLKTAQNLLLEAESVMVGAIKAFGANPLKEQIASAKAFIETNFKIMKRPVPEQIFLRFLYNEIPLQYVDAVIMALVNSAYIRAVGDAPNRVFTPVDMKKEKKEGEGS
jgi:hypothetical protein